MLKFLVNKLLDIFDWSYDRNTKNIERQLQRNALIDSTHFVEKHMINVKSFEDKFSLINFSLELAENEGLFIEFGVFKGTTINFISNTTDKTVYSFDSFEGLPQSWRDGFSEGTFKLNNIPKVNKNVKLIKGLFEESIPSFLKENEDTCSFIHIDCDLYSSTKTIFDLLHSKIKKNTIIVFDEFFNYPGWKNGEYKAFMEFVEYYKIKYEYIGYCKYDEQVAVQILGNINDL